MSERGSVDEFRERAGASGHSLYVTAITVGTPLILVGGWLPWRRMVPIEGPSTPLLYPLPFLRAMDYGFHGYKTYAVVSAILAPIATVVAIRVRDWRPDVPVATLSIVVLYVSGSIYLDNLHREYAGHRYVASEPGLYLVIAGGCLMAAVALYGLLLRFGGTAADRGEPEVG